VVQLRLTGDLIGNQPLHRETSLVGKGLRAASTEGIATITAAGQVGELEIGETVHSIVEAILNVALKPLGERRKLAGIAGDHLFHPDNLDLLARDACILDPLVNDL